MREKLQTIIHQLSTRQEGVALAMVLLLTTVMLFLGIFGSRSARIELQIARNDLLSKKALPIAEAGINHAFSLIKGDMADGFNDERAGSNRGEGDGIGSVS